MNLRNLPWSKIAQAAVYVAFGTGLGVGAEKMRSAPTQVPVQPEPSKIALSCPAPIVNVDFSKLKIPACPQPVKCPDLVVDGVKR